MKTKDNNLSLCITCYDLDYHLINRTLSFFQKSTQAPKEIIIVSSGLKNDYLQKKSYIEINKTEVPIININSEQRHNQAKARNIGAKTTKNELIMFFDVDDIPHPQKIEITTKIILENDIDAVVHDYTTDGKFETVKNYKIYEELKNNLTCTNIYVEGEKNFKIHHSHILCKTKIFNDIQYREEEEFFRKEDGKFCQDLLAKSFKLVYINKELVFYTN